jgi:transposase
MPSSAVALPVSADDQAVLRRWAHATQAPAALVRRAKILLLAAEGVANTEIAERLGISRPTVIAWRRRYAREGLTGQLADRPRRGRPQTVRRVRRAEILATTLARPPEHLGVTHWSSRLLATTLGVSHSTVARVWAEHDVKPWQTETFKFSTDPELEAKVRDVVGLYLDPPAHAIVVCVDEKSQIQALQRTQPVQPVRQDESSGAPTTTSATARRRCLPRWRSPPGGSPMPVILGIAIASFWPSSSWSPGPTRAASCMWWWTTTPPTSTSGSRPGWPGTRGSGCTSPRRMPPG